MDKLNTFAARWIAARLATAVRPHCGRYDALTVHRNSVGYIARIDHAGCAGGGSTFLELSATGAEWGSR